MDEVIEKIKRKKKKVRMNAFDWVNYILFGVLALMMIYPFWYVVIGAFSDGVDYSFGGVWFLPRKWSLLNFKMIIDDSRLFIAYRNTIARTFLGTLTSTFFTATVAYAMSRSDLPCKGFFKIFNVFTMFFSGGFIPYFLIINSLGFYDTFWVYIIPALYSVSNMIIISSFYKNIHEELHEAALIDGANELIICYVIYMPLARIILATVALWTAVGHWNAYFNTMIFTRNPQLITLQYYLLKVIKESSLPSGDNLTMAELEQVNSTTVSYAAILVATIPILLAYPFISKTFTADVMSGSVKG